MMRIAVLLALLSGPADAAEVTALRSIPLTPGVNLFHGLAPDGGDLIVVRGWRDNGNAHGYHLMLVMVRDPTEGWAVARVESGVDEPGSDVIRDDPHTGEDAVGAVRLARATIDGKPATLLLAATRDTDPTGIPNPTEVTFETWRLVDAGDAGTTATHFHLIERARVAARACNAEMALAGHFRLPLPADYERPTTEDGCPTPTR